MYFLLLQNFATWIVKGELLLVKKPIAPANVKNILRESCVVWIL